MRVVIGIVAVIIVGAVVVASQRPSAWLPPMQPGPGTGQVPGTGVGQVRATEQPGFAVPQARTTPLAPSAHSATPAAREVSIPPAIAAPAPIQLPATLELVALPAISGASTGPAKTITRAQAVAAAMSSREFQETVTPLARLYFATFGRFPDYEGLNYYTGQREEARPLHEIANEFVGSREFGLRYGELDNAQFVELIFNNVLGHPSQADVRNYWVDEINTGRMTRGQVLVDLAESGAFRERSAHQVFVSTAYTEILRRTPDPAGYNYWLEQLRAGRPAGSVITGLLGGR